jgi:rod shape-determining protein MreC
MPPYPSENDEGRGRARMWVALAFLATAMLLRGVPPGAQQEVAALIRGSLLRPFLAIQESLAQTRLRTLEVEDLQAELDSLVAALTGQRTLAEENRRLKGLLELQERAAPVFRAVSVLRPGTAGSESMFLVDAGTLEGVTAGAPVVTRRGLVGVIREAGRGSSVGMDWTYPDFRAGAMTVDGEVYGIVEPRRGRFREEDRLLLNGTAFTDRVEPGTLIVTSGLGGVYPRGIAIGTVLEEAEAEAGWRRSYWLVPAVTPASVTHAQVMIQRDEAVDSLWTAVQGESP